MFFYPLPVLLFSGKIQESVTCHRRCCQLDDVPPATNHQDWKKTVQRAKFTDVVNSGLLSGTTCSSYRFPFGSASDSSAIVTHWQGEVASSNVPWPMKISHRQQKTKSVVCLLPLLAQVFDSQLFPFPQGLLSPCDFCSIQYFAFFQYQKPLSLPGMFLTMEF